MTGGTPPRRPIASDLGQLLDLMSIRSAIAEAAPPPAPAAAEVAIGVDDAAPARAAKAPRSARTITTEQPAVEPLPEAAAAEASSSEAPTGDTAANSFELDALSAATADELLSDEANRGAASEIYQAVDRQPVEETSAEETLAEEVAVTSAAAASFGRVDEPPEQAAFTGVPADELTQPSGLDRWAESHVVEEAAVDVNDFDAAIEPLAAEEDQETGAGAAYFGRAPEVIEEIGAFEIEEPEEPRADTGIAEVTPPEGGLGDELAQPSASFAVPASVISEADEVPEPAAIEEVLDENDLNLPVNGNVKVEALSGARKGAKFLGKSTLAGLVGLRCAMDRFDLPAGTRVKLSLIAPRFADQIDVEDAIVRYATPTDDHKVDVELGFDQRHDDLAEFVNRYFAAKAGSGAFSLFGRFKR